MICRVQSCAQLAHRNHGLLCTAGHMHQMTDRRPHNQQTLLQYSTTNHSRGKKTNTRENHHLSAFAANRKKMGNRSHGSYPFLRLKQYTSNCRGPCGGERRRPSIRITQRKCN